MGASWNDVQEGMEIPTLTKNCSTQQLVYWAAGSGDFYQIHYDHNFARGHGSRKHHRARRAEARLPGATAARLGGQRGTGEARGPGSYRGMDFPDQEIQCKGVVTRKYEENGEKLVDLEIWTENPDGARTSPGSATVRLP